MSTLPQAFRPALLACTMLLCAAQAQAQLYKTVGPDGKITYSDTPPAANQKLLETRNLNPAAESNRFPYELSLAVGKNPVTIYTGNNCAPCNEGKSLLKSAGIPFAEKTVKTKEDSDKLQQVSGDTQLPYLQVGGRGLHGYNTEDWKGALSSAGYPATNMLPGDYRYPAAESAAPVTTAANKAAEPVAKKKKQPEPVKKEADNGFRF